MCKKCYGLRTDAGCTITSEALLRAIEPAVRIDYIGHDFTYCLVFRFLAVRLVIFYAGLTVIEDFITKGT